MNGHALTYALETDLQPRVRRVLIELALLTDTGQRFMSAHQISKACHLPEQAVRRAIDVLEQDGLIDDRRDVLVPEGWR